MNVRYRVELSQAERGELTAMLSKGKRAARKLKRAQIFWRPMLATAMKSHALPVSLSLPLREDAFRGDTVTAVFENLLADSDALRRQVAEKVGAAGTDAYRLLAAIGRDSFGALQFVGDADNYGDDFTGNHAVAGEVMDGIA